MSEDKAAYGEAPYKQAEEPDYLAIDSDGYLVADGEDWSRGWFEQIEPGAWVFNGS